MREERIDTTGVNMPVQDGIRNFKEWDDDTWWLANAKDGITYETSTIYMERFNVTRHAVLQRVDSIGLKTKKVEVKISKAEQEVADYLMELGVTLEQSDRTLIAPLELDIVVPSKHVAIEFNGIYFHSAGNKAEDTFIKNRHRMKTDLCRKQGIQLFHVFETEWYGRSNDIWKSVLANSVGKTKFKLGARHTTIREVPTGVARTFEYDNHLQGKSNGVINYGLYYGDVLMSLMSFGTPRFNKGYDYELIRFCNKKHTTVIGGASKLLKHFEREHARGSTIVTYANRRWSNGELYEMLGFTKQHISNNNYYYFYNSGPIHNKVLYSRNKFQKHKLLKLLGKDAFDETLTESENMFNNGYRKIYDSGNITYTKVIPEGEEQRNKEIRKDKM
jgi:hypothetical protein